MIPLLTCVSLPQTVASAAACVFLVAIGAAIVLDAVHKSSAPADARISDAIKGLAVSGTSWAANNGFFLRAGLSPKHHAPGADLAWQCYLLLQRRRNVTNLGDPVDDSATSMRVHLCTNQHVHSRSAQELHEMLAQSETLRQFTMLEQIDVKRAMACPIGSQLE